ncbi:sodium:proton antiporter [Methylocystis sp. Sn-Cys]|uniref:cation:proton antiporter n=1 Tax=Methylocystis sp. Sn-Cys TaxID=1701263 RepID=UPI001920E716|nr:sodium:proton antiporter [Methylocystis sp. Sn-Cys]MBL1256308.1 sodium:proton antiporter [Methylocystis sp. Sn-Cys]
MDESIGQVVLLLAVAMIVAIGARQIKLPYTVGLVVVGAALTLSHTDFGPHLTHDLIYDLILPPLLFEAALSIPWRELRRDGPPILALSTLGTAAAAAAVAIGMTWLLGWPLASALVYGSLIAATDPVAIIAMFKDNKIHGRMRLLVEAESLMNDGAAAVLFAVTLGWALAGGGEQLGLETLGTLARIVLGGIGVGAACGAAAILLAGRASEHLVEAALTTIAAFSSFLLAEHLHVSGVLATVTAGLMMGNLGLLSAEDKSYLTRKGREFVVSFWEYAAFVANSVVFLLIGIDVAGAPFESYGPKLIAGAILIGLIGRALTVYPISSAFLRSRWAVTFPEQHVLWWGGLRGALGLALALSLPPTLPMRDEIMVATFAVVGFSIVIQGLTMPLLLRRLGFLDEANGGPH